MASIVQIWNSALSHVGASARVVSASPPDSSVEAGHCASFYDIARTEALELGSWGFSLARAVLAPAANPSTVWAFAYAKPSECLSPRRILIGGADVFFAGEPNDADSAPFTVEGDVLLTNAPQATLVYVRDVTDTTKFTPSFTAALSYLLGSYIAGPIVKGADGARLADGLRQRGIAMAEASGARSANSGSEQTVFTPAAVAARR